MPLTKPSKAVTMTVMKKPARVGRPRAATTTHFSKWLDAHGMSRDAAAKELEVTRGQIDKLARGAAVPAIELMWAIHALSEGKVSLREWYLVALKRAPAGRLGRRRATKVGK